MDRCGQCRFVWFDAGEIAKWQLNYESSEQGQEARRFRERLANMKPHERDAFEQRIANLAEENPAIEVAATLSLAMLFRIW